MAKRKEADQAKRKLRKWPWILGVLIVIGVVVAVTSNSGNDATSPPPADIAEPQSGAIGQPVRDGLFEFTVVGVDYQPSVGGPHFSETAQGQYVLVTVRVRNIGDEPRGLSDADQYLFDSNDRRYAADSVAGMAIPNNEVLYTPINPGNGVEGTLVFDVPVNAKPDRVELHDSTFSGGVSVVLG
ncbi:DUF4352 domain-containing protein [Saccharomonospora xinjiangensis]|uniref:DUF4352 domain-containing protein n=1 Tax=Saccharomonospora xinjiangensis TaxID=75294 RepID=UPI00350F5266